MGKIAGVQQVRTADLVPYERNAKIHSEEQVEKIAKSIEEFGFLAPVVIDQDKNILAGHGRVMAAELLGLETVPCVFIEGLTKEQARAYILADNKLGEAPFNMEIVLEELEALELDGFDIEITGFDLPDTEDWFEKRERYDNDNEDEDDEYKDFVEKFEPKRTTDDCYTPDEVYEAIAEWVAKEYRLDRKTFHRPFYPGGDYAAENYAGKVVVDNPPFSILSEILRFYDEHNVRFFLFAPTLTLFSSSSSSSSTALPVGVGVTYENGAVVSTSFLTNLEDRGIRVKSSPALYQLVKEANDKSIASRGKKELPKYSYPDEVITAAGVAKYSKYGIEFQVTVVESEGISNLDAQKDSGKAIYGKGYLISEKAAAEKAAAEKAAAEKAAATRWPLSEREREIVRRLST